nr:MAG TPA: tail collar fiber protein [Caudoviricetes sp.]
MAKSVADYQTAFQNFMEKGARYYACPTGTMLPFAGKTVPAGFLLCNGAAISRTTYARLFSVLGTTWGAGDGSTTFNLPNVNDRCLEGTTNTANVGKYLEAGLPDISGEFCQQYSGEPSTIFGGFHMNAPVLTGAFEKGRKVSRSCQWGNYGDDYGLKIRLSKANTIYGKSSTTQPKTFYTLMIVKI